MKFAFPVYTELMGRVDGYPPDWLDTLDDCRFLIPIAPEQDPEEWLDRCGGFDNLLKVFGPNDIVWVPLYKGTLDAAAPLNLPRMDSYMTQVEVIKVLAPRVKGIMTGTGGPEMLRRCCQVKLNEAGEPESLVTYMPWEDDVKLMVDFVKKTAPLIVGAGGTPVYGTIDWGVLDDCYVGNGALRSEIEFFGGWQIVLCGYTFVPGAHLNEDHPDYKLQKKFAAEYEGGDPGLPKLSEFVKGGNFWSGTHGLSGLKAGNDRILSEFGFKAGVCYYGM